MAVDPDPDPAMVPAMVNAALLRPVRPGNAFEDTVGPAAADDPARGAALRGTRCRPNASSPLGSASAGTRSGRRSSRLADAGYLVSRRGRYGGTFLAEELPTPTDGSVGVSRAELDDALRLREILEVGAARMAAGRTLTAAEREGLWSRLADVRGAAADDYRRLDSRLHLAITEAAGSPSLVPLVAENRMRLNALLDQIPLLRRNITHSDDQHEAIVIAILAGDADAAASAMQAHVAGSAVLLHGFLD